MGVPYSPIVRRRRLGAELRALRDVHAMTGRQVVQQLGWRSQSKLTRIEKGISRVEVGDVLDLLDLYGVTGAAREKLVTIAREAADRRAVDTIAGIGTRQREYAQLESGAVLIREYQQFLVPGLLQTPEYVRTRLDSGRRLHPDVDRDVDARARQLRQEVLSRDPAPAYEAVIDEAALLRSVAAPAVVRTQLERLLAVSAMPNVTVRILPSGHPVADYYVPHTPFSIYRFADPDDPALVVVETLTSDLEIRETAELDLYETTYTWLVEASLPEGDSRTLIRAVINEM